MTKKSSGLVKAVLIGLVALLLGALLSDVLTSPAEGHRLDVKKLPPPAQAILNERPGVPISPEQWKRLDQVMAQHGGWPSGGDLFLASVRASWYWFLLLPAVCLGGLFIRWRAVTAAELAAVCAPSLGLLLLAFVAAVPVLNG